MLIGRTVGQDDGGNGVRSWSTGVCTGLCWTRFGSLLWERVNLTHLTSVSSCMVIIG